MQRVWAAALQDHWRYGDRAGFLAALNAAEFVPESADTVHQWRRRARWIWYPWYGFLTVARWLKLRRLWNAVAGRAFSAPRPG
jgi:hypothetical protein